MRKLMIVCILTLLAFTFVGLAYAEVQNIKVNGEIDVKGIARRAFDLNASTDAGNAQPRTTATGNSDWFFMSTAKVGVAADLTDNVSAVVSVLNQRDWDVTGKNHTAAATAYTANPNEFNVNLEQAYVKLSQFFYEPLTITIGRQPLWFGKGLIIGANYSNPDPDGNITAHEFSEMTKFDALRANLDLDPWMVDVIYSKIWENDVSDPDDTTLVGANVGYKFNVMNSEAEAYYFGKDDQGSVIPYNGAKVRNVVNTWGIRGSMDPIKTLNIAAEGAYQNGTYLGGPRQGDRRERHAWAVDLMGEYSGIVDQFTWRPKVGAEWMYLSGPGMEEDSGFPAPNGRTGNYRYWDPMYTGKFTSQIRQYIGWFYPSAQHGTATDQDPVTGLYEDTVLSNKNEMLVYLTLNPIDSLTLRANYNFFWFAHRLVDNRSTYNGSEFDLTAKYDYTEDVSFNVLAGFFAPGAAYSRTDSRSVAAQMVGSVKVNF